MADEPEPAWIERVVNLAKAIGMNPVRVRWKLVRWQDSRRRAARRREQKVEHVRYAHKTCHECGSVQDRDAKTCSKCGVKLASRTVHVLSRLGIFAPEALSMATLLALAIMACYVRVMIAQGGGFKTPSGALLLDFGAQWNQGRPDERWRMLTAAFLHIGLFHIAFNLLGLASIGPQIEALYGRMTMLAMFIITAVGANFASGLIAPHYLSAGASGGLCGLIGLAAGYAQRRGRTSLRNDMLKWLAYTIIMGFALGADNWAHTFGALIGGAIGYAFSPEVWKRPVLFPLRAVVKLAGLAAAIAAIVIIMTRHVTPDEQPLDPAVTYYEGIGRVCTAMRDGHYPLAVSWLNLQFGTMGDAPKRAEAFSEDSLRSECNELIETVKSCRTKEVEDCGPMLRILGDKL